MKIAAAVILYHPPANVMANIESYYQYVDEIFMFDNSETATLSKDNFTDTPKIHFYQDFENKGIASRLNTACSLALEKGFEWLLTMDQDSKFCEDAIRTYASCFQQYENKDRVAMFGTNYHRERASQPADCNCRETERLITSGMLLNLSAYKTIGGFDEALFIDLVDDEYCIAAKKAGYAVIQFSNVYISHNLGKHVYASSIKSLYLVKKYKTIHPPLRCYYMYRNMLYIEDKYRGSKIPLAKAIRKIVISHIKVCVLYGRQPIKIIKYLLVAKRDFKNNKMGKFNQEG